jgi:hypothetical protein
LTLLKRLLAGVEEMGDNEDPVYLPNIQQYLTEFLRSFSQQQQSYFQAFLPQLTDQEKQVLASIGVK